MYITVSHKIVDEMAAQYGFNQEQKDYLAELLKDENNSMWSAVLYGISYSDGEIVTIALSTGETASKMLDYMFEQNDNSESIFCGKVDEENIGIIGYSQGGAGALRAVTEYDNSNQYKTIFTGSASYPLLRAIYRDRREIHLTTKEYDLLSLLVANKGRVLTYEQIYNQVWGEDSYGNEKSIGYHICNLREKLFEASFTIRCVRDVGYCFELND